MKKLLVVFAAITLVFGFAVTAMAADASFSGDFNFGFATVFDWEKDAMGWGDLELNFEIMADDYNTVTIETNFENLPIGGTGWFAIDTAKLDTDLGAYFGLPVGLVHSAGFHEPGGESYPDETTGYEFEDVTEDGLGEATTAIGLEANYDDIAIIDVAFSVAQGQQGDLDDVTAEGGFDAYFGVAVPDIADLVSAEAYYAIQDSSEFKGFFGIDAQTAPIADMVTAGFSFTFATLDDADPDKAWDWTYGIGASAEVSIAKIGVSLQGNSEDTLDLLGIDCNLGLTDDFGADVGACLGFFDGADTLQHVDLSAYASVGTATVRLGYVITDQSDPTKVKDPDYKAPAILQDGKGGLYFNVGTEF
jgi:hypothetical protein